MENQLSNPSNEEKFFKATLEHQRYKQDCRKRALDLAHTSIFNKQAGTPNSDDVAKEADKYYNWLISIPEK